MRKYGFLFFLLQKITTQFSLFVFIYLFTYLFIYLFIYLFMYLFTYFCMYLFIFFIFIDSLKCDGRTLGVNLSLVPTAAISSIARPRRRR